jgi:hypothetical protein
MTTMPQQKPGKSRQDYRTPADFVAALKRRLGIVEFTITTWRRTRRTRRRDRGSGQGATTTRDAFRAPSWARYCRHGWGFLNPEYSDIEPMG